MGHCLTRLRGTRNPDRAYLGIRQTTYYWIQECHCGKMSIRFCLYIAHGNDNLNNLHPKGNRIYTLSVITNSRHKIHKPTHRKYKNRFKYSLTIFIFPNSFEKKRPVFNKSSIDIKTLFFPAQTRGQHQGMPPLAI